MARLGDIFSLIRNGISIRQTAHAGGIPITRIETISNREVNRNKLGYAGIVDTQKYRDYFLRDRDILMSHINSEKHLGKVALYHQDGAEQIIHGMNLLLLRAKQSIVLPEYAFYYFDTPQFLHQIARITKKSVNQASFSVTALKELHMNLLPIREQQHIVLVLDKISSLISLRRQQLLKLDALVKARFVELFGDPVRNPNCLPTRKLSELGSLERGRSQHRPRNAPELLNGPYPLVQTGEITSAGLYITEYQSTYSELGLKQSKMWKAGTLCITIAANIAQTAILTFDACFPDSVVGFLPKDDISAVYLHYWFDFFQKILEEQAPQVAQKNINLKILEGLDVMVPGAALQEQFAAFTKQANKSKMTIQRSLAQLEALKKSLMQAYFA